jgi:integrin beta 3
MTIDEVAAFMASEVRAYVERTVPVMLEQREAPLLARIAELESQVKSIEAVPGPAGPAGPQGERGEAGETGAAGRDGTDGAKGEPGPAGPAGETGPQGERGADGTAGPAGVDGAPGERGADGAKGIDGRDGRDGKDGRDGIATRDEIDAAFKSLFAEHETAHVERITSAIKAALPDLRFCGVWRDGEHYNEGNLVVCGGSLFHCNETGTADRIGNGPTKGWTMVAQRGRDGRDLREPPEKQTRNAPVTLR